MHYAYWIAPIAGAALAGLVYRLVWVEEGAVKV
jgi:glycerol uptake facilitator-like aquaporin